MAQAEAESKLASDDAALQEKANNVEAATQSGDKNATKKAVNELVQENNKTRTDIKKAKSANTEAAANSDADSNVDTATIVNNTGSASEDDNANKTVLEERANQAGDAMTKGGDKQSKMKVIRDMAYGTNSFKKSAPIKETPCNASSVNETESAVKMAELKTMLAEDEKNQSPAAQKEISELIHILSGGADSKATAFLQMSSEQKTRVARMQYMVLQRLQKFKAE